jgi:DNA-binding NarL/FixJ family response regulator
VSVPQKQHRAVLVDQHPIWLDTVAKVVAKAEIGVAGTATSSADARRLVDEHEPDLLVTGMKMATGEADGIDLIVAAKRGNPELKCVVLSMYEDQEHIDAAFRAGADAYVLKTAHPDVLAAAVRQAFEPSIFLAPARPPVTASAPTPDNAPGLTRRELEILQLVGEGHSNAQVARALWVTEQTVKFHLSNIYRKLDVSNRTEASRWAQLQGLLNSPLLQAA